MVLESKEMEAKQALRTFILELLRDDAGISESAWDELTEYLQCAGEFELLGELSSKVKSTTCTRRNRSRIYIYHERI